MELTFIKKVYTVHLDIFISISFLTKNLYKLTLPKLRKVNASKYKKKIRSLKALF